MKYAILGRFECVGFEIDELTIGYEIRDIDSQVVYDIRTYGWDDGYYPGAEQVLSEWFTRRSVSVLEDCFASFCSEIRKVWGELEWACVGNDTLCQASFSTEFEKITILYRLNSGQPWKLLYERPSVKQEFFSCDLEYLKRQFEEYQDLNF